MVTECWSILCILAIIFLVFLRVKKKNYAFASIPLAVVPFGYIISGPIAMQIAAHTGLTYAELRVALIVLALVVSCIAIVLLAGTQINARRPRIIYILFCSGFSLILTWLFIFNIIKL